MTTLKIAIEDEQANSAENEKPAFSPAEIERLKEALKRSYKERFEMCTRL